jgi:hypothetical protein
MTNKHLVCMGSMLIQLLVLVLCCLSRKLSTFAEGLLCTPWEPINEDDRGTGAEHCLHGEQHKQAWVVNCRLVEHHAEATLMANNQ